MTAKYSTDGTPPLQDLFASRAATGTVAKSGNSLADGVLSGYEWNSASITYAFPDQRGDYGYRGERDKGFAEVNGKIKEAVRWTLDQNYGNAANDGFSVEGLTNLSISAGNDRTADIRYGESRMANPTAYAYYPVNGKSPATSGSAPARSSTIRSPATMPLPPSSTRTAMRSASSTAMRRTASTSSAPRCRRATIPSNIRS